MAELLSRVQPSPNPRVWLSHFSRVRLRPGPFKDWMKQMVEARQTARTERTKNHGFLRSRAMPPQLLENTKGRNNMKQS